MKYPVLGIDDGFDCTKVVGADTKLMIPTQVSLSKRVGADVMPGQAGAVDGAHYEIDGAVYAVGEQVSEPMDTRYDGFATSEANLAIAIHAIRSAGIVCGDVNVVTGMPVTRFYTRGGDVRRETLEAKAAAWRRPVTLQGGGECPRIAHVAAVSEAVAGWLDYVVDNDGRIREELANQYVAIGDAGGRTYDLAVIQNGQVLMNYSGTMDHGMLDIYEAVSAYVADTLNAPVELPKYMLADAVRSGVIRVGAREVDVRGVVDRQKKELAERIQAFAHSRLGSQGMMIDKFLHVGGTAVALKDRLHEVFPKISEIPPEPQFANARGMYKYGLIQAQSAGSEDVADAPAQEAQS